MKDKIEALMAQVLALKEEAEAAKMPWVVSELMEARGGLRRAAQEAEGYEVAGCCGGPNSGCACAMQVLE